MVARPIFRPEPVTRATLPSSLPITIPPRVIRTPVFEPSDIKHNYNTAASAVRSTTQMFHRFLLELHGYTPALIRRGLHRVDEFMPGHRRGEVRLDSLAGVYGIGQALIPTRHVQRLTLWHTRRDSRQTLWNGKLSEHPVRPLSSLQAYEVDLGAQAGRSHKSPLAPIDL